MSIFHQRDMNPFFYMIFKCTFRRYGFVLHLDFLLALSTDRYEPHLIIFRKGTISTFDMIYHRAAQPIIYTLRAE